MPDNNPSRITQPEQYLAALRRVIEALRAKRNGTGAERSADAPRGKQPDDDGAA